MFPRLQIGDTIISWYSLILNTSLVFCTIFFLIRFRRQSMDNGTFSKFKIFLFPIIVIVIGSIGTRLVNIVEHLYQSGHHHSILEIKTMIFEGSGSQFYGAPVFILLFTPLLLKIYPLKEWLFFWDVAAPVWCLGYALGRIGCLIVSIRPTTSFFW